MCITQPSVSVDLLFPLHACQNGSFSPTLVLSPMPGLRLSVPSSLLTTVEVPHRTWTFFPSFFPRLARAFALQDLVDVAPTVPLSVCTLVLIQPLPVFTSSCIPRLCLPSDGSLPPSLRSHHFYNSIPVLDNDDGGAKLRH